MTRVYITNGISPTMFPTPCNAVINTITIDEAKKVLGSNFISAIGHESTAKLLSELLGISIPMNRITVKAEYNDIIIVLALKNRIPEGKVLSKEEIEQIGYELYSIHIKPSQ